MYKSIHVNNEIQSYVIRPLNALLAHFGIDRCLFNNCYSYAHDLNVIKFYGDSSNNDNLEKFITSLKQTDHDVEVYELNTNFYQYHQIQLKKIAEEKELNDLMIASAIEAETEYQESKKRKVAEAQKITVKPRKFK